MLGKKGDRSGSGLALVILVAPSPETALVGGKQGQEAGQEHSEWAELCPGTRGSQECLLWQCNVSPLTPWVTCDLVTLWSHCPHRQGLTRGITDNNIQTVYRQSGYRKGRLWNWNFSFEMSNEVCVLYQVSRPKMWELRNTAVGSISNKKARAREIYHQIHNNKMKRKGNCIIKNFDI